jgi:hypothetical protein
MGLPSLDDSQVVLIGTAQYDHLEQLPGVANNLRDLSLLLSVPNILGIPASNCSVIPDPAVPADIIEPLARAADRAKDTLIVYYAGHGLLDEERNLHLALTGAQSDGADYTAVGYRLVRKRIFESPALRKIVVLDCCYAARAFGMGDAAPNITEKATIEGTYLLAAVAENGEALALPGEPHTMFTGELIKLLRDGETGGPEFFEMDYIYRRLRDTLEHRNLPAPQAQNRNHIASLTLFRNVKYAFESTPRETLRPVPRSAAERQARSTCIGFSQQFLRRNKVANHDSIYVPRTLDRDLMSAVRALSPSRLAQLTRQPANKKKALLPHGGPLYREAPPQLAIILDPPGSGKTMLATQFALSNDAYLCVARTADSPDAPDLAAHLEALGKHDHGLSLMRDIDKPFVYVLDGLDENDTPQKRADVVRVLKTLGELNQWATHNDLLAFPAFIMLTARKDVWERWISVFEGRSVIRFRDRLRNFADDELEIALTRYSNAYQYSFAKPISMAARNTLSVPFNLRVLSEVFEYNGEDVPVERALSKHVLTSYFEWLASQFSLQIASLTEDSFIASLCDLALASAPAPQGQLDEGVAVQQLALRFGNSPDATRDFLELLVQARLLVRELGGGRWLRFRYSPVVEYLMGLSVVRNPSLAHLESVTLTAAKSTHVSPIEVKQNVLSLARSSAPDVARQAARYYNNSPTYISGAVSSLRIGFAGGERTAADDIEAIYKTIDRMHPDKAFDAFFVIAAKPNDQPEIGVLAVFQTAWRLNDGRPDRWKILEKLADRELVTRPLPIAAICSSRDPREWEVFLGRLHERDDMQQVAIEIAPAFSNIAPPDDPAWSQARGLLELAERGNRFDLGSVLS